MSDGDADVTVGTPVVRGISLTVTVQGHAYTVDPPDAPITIGRVFPAQIQVDDHRISRTHLRLECDGSRWTAVDHSRNGVFLDGRSVPSADITSGMTLHLGHPEGISVGFSLTSGTEATHTVSDRTDEDDDIDDDDSGETTGESEYLDPGVARAGAAVAARRRELNIAQRTLAKDKVVNAGALIAFEKGRSWPRQDTLDKLERVLGWAPGTIGRIRWGEDADAADTAAESTVVMTNTVQAPFMVQAMEVALHTIGNQASSLPAPTDAEFTRRVGPVLADLRKLERVAANAAKSANWAPEVVMVLSSVRRQYRDLMLRAARSPRATLGQQVFAARHRAEISAEEAANVAGVSVTVLSAAEADQSIPPGATAAMQALLDSLTRR